MDFTDNNTVPPCHKPSGSTPPPFSSNVTNNIDKKFLQLLDKNFLRGHRFHKLFNRNTVKLTYSCLPNVCSILASTRHQAQWEPIENLRHLTELLKKVWELKDTKTLYKISRKIIQHAHPYKVDRLKPYVKLSFVLVAGLNKGPIGRAGKFVVVNYLTIYKRITVKICFKTLPCFFKISIYL